MGGSYDVSIVIDYEELFFAHRDMEIIVRGENCNTSVDLHAEYIVE